MTPLQLKAALVASGVTLDDGLEVRLRTVGIPTGTLDVTLPTGLVASVPIVARESTGAYRIVDSTGRAELADPSGVPSPMDARIRAASRFAARHTTRGVPMHRIAERRGRVLLVHPLGRCGYSIIGRPCTFCIEGGRPTTPAAAATPADVVETVGTAMREGTIDVVLFNSDSAEGDDGGIAFLTPYVQAVRRHAHVLVAAHLHPPRTSAWVDRSYAIGLDAVSYGLELYDEGAFSRLCVGRARYVGRDRYLAMLERAALVFPRGAVWSELVLGVEPVERTEAGINHLAEIGVVPVLALARATGGRPHLVPATDLDRLTSRLTAATHAHQLPTRWISALGGSITPDEVEQTSGDHTGRMDRLRRRLASRGARPLSRLRRRLRVRRADASAPSH